MIKKIKHHFEDSLYKNAFFIMLTSISSSGFGFIFWVLAAKFYPKEDVGISTAIISAMMLLTVISNVGMNFSIIRFFPENNKSRIFSTSLIVTTVFTILFGILFILGVDIFSPKLHLLQSPLNSWLFLLFSAAASIAGLMGISFVAIRQAKLYFLQSLLVGSRILFLIPFVFLGTMGILSSVGVSFILASLILLFPLMQAGIRPQLMIDKDFMSRTYAFSVGNYLTSLFMSAPTYILPMMVLSILGADATAYFYVTFMIASLLSMIPNAVSTSLLVEGSHGEALKKSVIKSLYVIFLMLAPVIVFLYFFGYFVLGFVGRDYSVNGLELLKIMVLASVFVAVTNVFSSIKRVQKDIKQLLLLGCMTFVLLLVLSYLLIPPFGLVGAGYAWFISYGIGAVVIGVLIWREKWV